MPTIRSLSQSMINKIAAGEVIERPASVVKELVENSIDAGATRIDVAIENGGSNLIRIVDNGHGIEPEQLTLALSPHATSKLTDANDLFRIRSFGFRGEALASVAEISQLSLKSRTPENDSGAMLQSNGGERTGITVCGMPVGTQIEVRNLFFNTPVRRRYMKSVTTEFGHVAETFIRLALPQTQIHFTFKHNGRIVHELASTDCLLTRIRQLFGDDVVREMIAVESPASAAVRVSGYVSHPSQHRANNRMQYFFLNRRYIRDRALQHALNEAYRGILVSGRFPLAFLQIELSPDMFDVNVHPTKMEVRFLDSNRIYTGFLGAIREKFLRSDLRSRGLAREPADGRQQMPADASPQTAGSDSSQDDPQNSLDPAATEKKRQMVQNWISHLQDAKQTDRKTQIKAPAKRPLHNDYSQLSIHHLPPRDADSTPAPAADSPPPAVAVSRQPAAAPPPPPPPLAIDPHPTVVQMLDRYLVMEMPDGIAIIDQHAMHERILYEQLQERMKSGRLDSQRLLVPALVDLSPNEFSCVQEHREFFQSLGLHAEAFGGNTVLISAFPAVLSKTLPEEILSALVEPVLTLGKKLGRAELLDKLLHSMACKAAVKAGEHLSEESMQHLIHQAALEINSHHCPHGRPSTIVFSRNEIDKMFERS